MDESTSARDRGLERGEDEEKEEEGFMGVCCVYRVGHGMGGVREGGRIWNKLWRATSRDPFDLLLLL
jgi:hypothetical protein